MTDLTAVDTKALEAELTRRREEEKRILREKRDLEIKRCEENISALLALVPEHNRTSCSDERPINSNRARCTRCALLEAKGGWDENLHLSIVVAYGDRYGV